MEEITVRISELPGADPLSGIELVPLVQNGVTKTRAVQSIVLEGGLQDHIDAPDPHPQYAFRVKNNLTATTDPTANDDVTQGYEPTSRWVNTVTEEFFICVTNTAGNANWQQQTLTLDELGSAALVDVGLNPVDVPQNQNLGTAAYKDDGAGNGLNADLLDGVHGSQFVRSDQDDVVAGQINFLDSVEVQVSSSDTATIGLDARDDDSIYARLHVFGRSSTGGTGRARLALYDGNSYHNIDVINNEFIFGGGLHATGGFRGDGSQLTNVDAETLDGINSSQFLRSDQDDSITGFLQAAGFVNANRILFPDGGAYITSSGDQTTVTGAIKITLPVSWSNTMIKMVVRVYEYTSNESFDIYLSGYNYATSSTWNNTTGYIIGSTKRNRDFTIRFGHDGTNCCIYIGETTDQWAYPQIYITEVQTGWNGTSVNTWHSGWDISFVDSFGTISSTIDNTQIGRYVDNYMVWHAGNDGSGSGLDADTVDGVQVSQLLRGDVNDSKTGYLWLQDELFIGNSAANAARLRVVGDQTRIYFQVYDKDDTSTPKEFSFSGYGGQDIGEFRVRHGGVYQDIWHSGNDGAGSGLDADTVDGLHGYQFVRSDTADTVSGRLTLTNSGGTETHYGIHGGYADSNGTGTDWGTPIWSMGDGYMGSGTGNSFTPGGYQLYWLRTGSVHQRAFVGEGLYIHSQNSFVAGFGTGGAEIAGRLKVGGDLLIGATNAKVGTNATRDVYIQTTEPLNTLGNDGDVCYVYTP